MCVCAIDKSAKVKVELNTLRGSLCASGRISAQSDDKQSFFFCLRHATHRIIDLWVISGHKIRMVRAIVIRVHLNE